VRGFGGLRREAYGINVGSSYWDYTVTPRRDGTKSWSKNQVSGRREAQRLADELLEQVNQRNNDPALFESEEETGKTSLAFSTSHSFDA
jgi:oligoendopeptidase F